MAPWSSKPSTAPEENATSRFRAFANENLTVLTANMSSLPGMHSTVEDPKAKSVLQDWQRENAESIKRMSTAFPSLFDALLASPNRRPGRGNEAVTDDHRLAARLLLLQARTANTGVTEPDKILDLYQDHGEHMLPVRGIVPIRASGTGGWLGIDWFRKSSYSPLQLEQHEDCHQHGSMWRAAFEDLLATTLDKPAQARSVWEGSEEDEGLYKAWGAAGMDWMLGLQVRGLLPPQLPSLYNISVAEKKKLDRVFGKVVVGKDLWTPYGKSVKRDFEKLAGVIASLEMEDLAIKINGGREAETELDLYEHFYEAEKRGKEEEDEQNKAETNQGAPSIKQDEKKAVDDGKQSIIATLTTTETTRSPDGTVRTRRVLKQRFADGREETREEESSTRDDNRSKIANGGANGDGNADHDNWFWT